MKVIETEYKGYRFRSRLEARWAVFFDACGVKWEYEPEGFDLGNGLYYLPDFLLHDVLIRNEYKQDLWVEVKGRMTKEDSEKISAFVTDNYAEPINLGTDAEPLYCGDYYIINPVIILSNIPDGDDINDIDSCIYSVSWGNEFFPYYGIYPFNFNNIDGDWYEAFPCINNQGYFALIGEQYLIGARDDEATLKAYRLARQARFEHK